MKQIILGTAGHIDHGKTSLIKALTGINTDRLKEEQKRGITIELGFANINLPSGQKLGIVDVPGHEKFVKNMVAGATGIDIVALVIAADEGIMPQTREHIEICTLLGIRHGIVTLTKIDMVDEEWLGLVQEEVADFTQGTFLESAPVIPVSSVTQQGLPKFLQALDQISAGIEEKSSIGLLRLPADRVFSMKGFGTVITGTLISGKVAVGDQIMIYPSKVTSKVRGLQVHNESVTLAEAGLRTAINFQGLDKTEVHRGDIIAFPDTLVPSYMIDVALHYLPGNPKPLKNRVRIRFHTGTSEILGVVILLDREEVAPGENVLAQIRLESPVCLVKDDRYVLRSYSPVRTIGGGPILNPIPPKHKRNRPGIIDRLSTIANAEDPEQIVLLHLVEAGFYGYTFNALLLMTNLAEKQLDRLLQNLMSKRQIIQIDKEKKNYVHLEIFNKLQGMVHTYLENYHKKNALKGGMPKEELKSKLPDTVSTKLFMLTLQHMTQSSKSIVQEENIVRLSTHKVALGLDQSQLREKIITAYKKAGLTPPYFKDLCQELETPLPPAHQVLSLLVEEGLIIKVKEDLYYHHQPLDELKQKLVDFLVAHGEIDTPQFKDMTGASRKFVIPLIEHFDATQLTIRVGDMRRLRKTPK